MSLSAWKLFLVGRIHWVLPCASRIALPAGQELTRHDRVVGPARQALRTARQRRTVIGKRRPDRSRLLPGTPVGAWKPGPVPAQANTGKDRFQGAGIQLGGFKRRRAGGIGAVAGAAGSFEQRLGGLFVRSRRSRPPTPTQRPAAKTSLRSRFAVAACTAGESVVSSGEMPGSTSWIRSSPPAAPPRSASTPCS